MRTEFGTTYNSYVLKGTEKTALFETNKLKFWEQYRESLSDVTRYFPYATAQNPYPQCTICR